ncbi:NYN domain-containing protein [Pseudomonas entomophila]|nr:NYN domain-containing protein [Pseudomonas entomophila]
MATTRAGSPTPTTAATRAVATSSRTTTVLSEVPGQAIRTPRVALFADVQNLYYTVRQAHGCHFDYSALWAQVSREGEIVEAKAYAIERGDSKQQQFQQILRNLGFEVRLKPFIQRSDGSAKGDWDVGITLDVVDAAPTVDRIVLASGDGDFDQLLQRVAERHGVETVVYGVPGLTASALIRAADRYVPIEGRLLLRR